MTATDHTTPYRYPCGQIVDSYNTHAYNCPACIAVLAKDFERGWQSRALAAEIERDALRAEVERLRKSENEWKQKWMSRT